MNCMIRSKLSIIAVLLIGFMPFVGCNQDPISLCWGMCATICLPFWIAGPWGWMACFGQCSVICPTSLQGSEDNPDDCAAMFELYQAAIDTCEAYPEECAEILDSYVQSFDTDAE